MTKKKKNAYFAKASPPTYHIVTELHCYPKITLDALDTALCGRDVLSDTSLLYNRICLTGDGGDETEPIHGDACRNQHAQGACVNDTTRLPETVGR